MNKQELIDRLKKLLTLPSEIQGTDLDFGHDYGIRRAIVLVKQLDDPVRPPEPKPLEIEKPVVPQFVAEFYESIKDDFEEGVYYLFVEFYEYEYRRELDTELYQWFKQDGNKQIETLVMMHKFGYEVDEEVEQCNQKH